MPCSFACHSTTSLTGPLSRCRKAPAFVGSFFILFQWAMMHSAMRYPFVLRYAYAIPSLAEPQSVWVCVRRGADIATWLQYMFISRVSFASPKVDERWRMKGSFPDCGHIVQAVRETLLLVWTHLLFASLTYSATFYVAAGTRLDFFLQARVLRSCGHRQSSLQRRSGQCGEVAIDWKLQLVAASQQPNLQPTQHHP